MKRHRIINRSKYNLPNPKGCAYGYSCLSDYNTGKSGLSFRVFKREYVNYERYSKPTREKSIKSKFINQKKMDSYFNFDD